MLSLPRSVLSLELTLDLQRRPRGCSERTLPRLFTVGYCLSEPSLGAVGNRGGFLSRPCARPDEGRSNDLPERRDLSNEAENNFLGFTGTVGDSEQRLLCRKNLDGSWLCRNGEACRLSSG